jgi:hypothetical protein
MAEVFCKIESVPHKEFVGCIEPHPARVEGDFSLVEEGTDLEARGTASA